MATDKELREEIAEAMRKVERETPRREAYTSMADAAMKIVRDHDRPAGRDPRLSPPDRTRTNEPL